MIAPNVVEASAMALRGNNLPWLQGFCPMLLAQLSDWFCVEQGDAFDDPHWIERRIPHHQSDLFVLAA